MPIEEKIIELYLVENNLALRYFGVASRLKLDPKVILDAMLNLEHDRILCRVYGVYYTLNPPSLWKNTEYVKTYGNKAEEILVNTKLDFLLSVGRLEKEFQESQKTKGLYIQ